MSNFIAKTATHTVTTTPADNAGVDSKLSIRQIITRGILAQTPKAEVEKQVVALHPNSAAAAKFGKHYAWYKGTMKKAGLLEGLVPLTAEIMKPKFTTIEEIQIEIERLREQQMLMTTGDSVMKLVDDTDSIEAKQLAMLAEVEARLNLNA